MISTPFNSVKLLAAVIWLAGSLILFVKGFGLLREAIILEPDQPWVWIALIVGFVIGGFKAKYLFKRLCYKNLKRIDDIKQPKLWHSYRIHFFIFLFLMVSLGAYMSRVAQGDYFMLISVAIVDLSIAAALLFSSVCFQDLLQSINHSE